MTVWALYITTYGYWLLGRVHYKSHSMRIHQPRKTLKYLYELYNIIVSLQHMVVGCWEVCSIEAMYSKGMARKLSVKAYV